MVFWKAFSEKYCLPHFDIAVGPSNNHGEIIVSIDIPSVLAYPEKFGQGHCRWAL